MKTNEIRGISVTGIFVLILVLGLVGFTGYKLYEVQQDLAYQNNAQTDDNGVVSPSPTPTPRNIPNKVSTAGELSDMERVLDATDVIYGVEALDSDIDDLQ